MIPITFPSCPLLVSETLDFGTQIFSEKGFDNPRLNAERLLGKILRLTRTDLYLNYDRPVNKTELSQYAQSMQRRLTHEPLQYIIGETEFMSLPFKVNSQVLIPRPETEILVETVLNYCTKALAGIEGISILDIGTGSGCIAISLAKHLPDVHLFAWDVSAAALQIAQENAEFNGVSERIEFRKVELFDSASLAAFQRKFDVMVSNPPYIADEDFGDLPREVREFEPAIALTDRDGLGFFNRLVDVALKIARSTAFIAVEVGLGQAEEVKRLFAEQGFTDATATHDFNQIERVVSCHAPSA
ncbi:peptide chain release factor N(5)-glutamine methyltransferase [bacterium]|nr:peptide chain release factor N(5)-glutamine methyltransferase [bacterium]